MARKAQAEGGCNNVGMDPSSSKAGLLSLGILPPQDGAGPGASGSQADPMQNRSRLMDFEGEFSRVAASRIVRPNNIQDSLQNMESSLEVNEGRNSI